MEASIQEAGGDSTIGLPVHTKCYDGTRLRLRGCET